MAKGLVKTIEHLIRSQLNNEGSNSKKTDFENLNQVLLIFLFFESSSGRWIIFFKISSVPVLGSALDRNRRGLTERN